MPQGLPTKAPGELIESAHINAIADRIVGRFANAAERDAAIPTPVAGMTVWRTDLGALEVKRAAGWQPVTGFGFYGFTTRPNDLVLSPSVWTTTASAVVAGMPAGKYLGFGILTAAASPAVTGSVRLETNTAGQSPWIQFVQVAASSAMNTAVIIWPFTSPTAGTLTVNLSTNPGTAGLTAKQGTCVGFVFLGL